MFSNILLLLSSYLSWTFRVNGLKKSCVCQVLGDPQNTRQCWFMCPRTCVHLASGRMFPFPFLKISKNPKHQQNPSQGIRFSLAWEIRDNLCMQMKRPMEGRPSSRSSKIKKQWSLGLTQGAHYPPKIRAQGPRLCIKGPEAWVSVQPGSTGLPWLNFVQ